MRDDLLRSLWAAPIRYSHVGTGIVAVDVAEISEAEQQQHAAMLARFDPAQAFRRRSFRCHCGHDQDLHRTAPPDPIIPPLLGCEYVGCACATFRRRRLRSVQIVGSDLPRGVILIWTGARTRRVPLGAFFADYRPLGMAA